MGRSSAAHRKAKSAKSKPYARPKNAVVCKCPLCLMEDSQGIVCDRRTALAHKKNFNITAPASYGAPTAQSGPNDEFQESESFDGPATRDIVSSESSSVDHLAHSLSHPLASLHLPRATVVDAEDPDWHSRGVNPLPPDSDAIMVCIDPYLFECSTHSSGNNSQLSYSPPLHEPPQTIGEPPFAVDAAPSPVYEFPLRLPRDPPRASPPPPAPKLESFRGDLCAGYNSSHDAWYIRSFFALAAVLHYKHQVSYAALSLLMWTVYFVFTALGLLVPVPAKPKLHKFTQWRTVVQRLQVDDAITVYPTCPDCHFIGSPTATSDACCPECGTALFAPRSFLAAVSRSKPVPVRPWGYVPLSYLLSLKLSDDALQAQIDAEMDRVRRVGEYHDTLDGAVMREMRGPDGLPLFARTADNELRVGVTLNGDAFDPHSSTYRDSHSTTAFSFAIANLVFAVRYQHLLVPTLVPGPKEPTCQELQRYLLLIVDDLINLFEHGILVYSPKYPEGRRLRVALVAVVCDHPAMCRMCGFADKNHNVAPCTKCKIPKDAIRTSEGVTRTYEPRTGVEQKRLALEWLELPDDKRQAHFNAHGQQWSELMRLPYFDPVRQTVIGPMHCLLNGVVKNLWYDTWIKGTKALRPRTDGGTTRELDFIHRMLDRFEVPSWVGRLPKVVGEPSGGSLSSDEWKWLATTFGPVVLPPLWYLTQSAADDEYAAATKRYKTKLRAHERLREQAEKSLKPDALADWNTKHPSPVLPYLRSGEEEIPMFLSLAASLRVLFGRSLTDPDVQRGGSLLLEHLKQYCELYKDEYLKFNQHWSTHVPPQVPDFGPVYGFWEFPGERVNKTLKNINTNNRRKGELELTMLRTHIQGILLAQTLDTVERSLPDGPEREVLRHLTAEPKALRGTVDNVIAEQDSTTGSELLKAQALSDELIGQQVALQLAPAGESFRLKPREQHVLVNYYRGLGLSGRPHPFVILDGRRIFPSASTSTSSSLVKLRRPDDDPSLTPCHGEVLNIFSHQHLSMNRTFATVRTFVDYAPGLMRGADWGKWSLYPEVEVEYWYTNRYAPVKVVPIEDIVCQIGRAWFEDPDIWMTVSLEKHRIRR